jgi:hypothetical protein
MKRTTHKQVEQLLGTLSSFFLSGVLLLGVFFGMFFFALFSVVLAATSKQ